MVDQLAEEICIATRLLSLASNKKFAASKQELRNDLVKGKDNYPRTVAGVMKFLQFHNLKANNDLPSPQTPGKKEVETAFITEGDGTPPDNKDQKSNVCGYWKKGECEFKEEHTWSECPRNKYSKNKDKKCDEKGQLLLCTVDEFLEDLQYNDDDLEVGDIVNDTDKLDDQFHSYTTSSFTYSSKHYAFVTWCDQLHASTTNGINSSWILLNSQSTVDLFCNPKLLQNIRKIDDTLTVRCNAGKIYTSLVGDLPGYGTVWFYAKGIANILSLYRVTSILHVHYDSRVYNGFTVYKSNGGTRTFKPAQNGLYYCNTDDTEGTILATAELDADQMQTVKDNMTGFTQRQIKEAKAARYFQNTVGLSTRAILKCIDSGLMRNCPITRNAMDIAQNIWGISRPYLQGKSTRQRNQVVELNTEVITPLPPNIINYHSEVVIGMDIMFVNGIPFLTTVSRIIKFGTCTEMSGANMDNVVTALRVIKATYSSRGFTIVAIAADNGFNALLQNEAFIQLEIPLNLTAEDEHEPYVERFNRTIKEMVRMSLAGTSFKKLPRRMTVEMVYGMIFWYNFRIPEDYISNTLGPAGIIIGRTYDFNMLCGEGSKFGEYVQTHEKTTNTMRARTVSAICLRPTGNTQGSFYYYSLWTGRRLHRRRRTPLPMPQEVVDRVHHIATIQKNPEELAFTRLDGTPFDDDEQQDDVSVQDNPPADELELNVPEEPEVHEGDGAGDAPPPMDDPEAIHDNDDAMDADVNDEINEHGDEYIEDVENAGVHEIQYAEDAENTGVQDIHNVENAGVPVDEPPIAPQTSTTRSGRIPSNRYRLYSIEEGYGLHLTGDEECASQHDASRSKYSLATSQISKSEYIKKMKPVEQLLCAQTAYVNSLTTYNEVNMAIQHAIEHLILTQVGMKRGVKIWGKKGMNAILKEMTQFHDRNVVRPLTPTQITGDIRDKALGYLMFLKQKRNGDIKGRGCADGRPQRLYKSKSETSSPTATTESVFIT